jgi:hypothetical protein
LANVRVTFLKNFVVGKTKASWETGGRGTVATVNAHQTQTKLLVPSIKTISNNMFRKLVLDAITVLGRHWFSPGVHTLKTMDI